MIGAARVSFFRAISPPGTVFSISADGVNGATALTVSWSNGGTPPVGGDILVRLRDDNLITTWQEQVEATSATDSVFDLTPWGYTIRKPTGTALVTFFFEARLRDVLGNVVSLVTGDLPLWVDVSV